MTDVGRGPVSPAGGFAPVGRITVADYVDYHMILDHELTTLSRSETGILGSFGFMGVGAAFGLAPAFIDAVSKIQSSPPQILKLSELFTVIFFTASVIIGAGCLMLWAIGKCRNAGIFREIRNRKKVSTSAQGAQIIDA